MNAYLLEIALAAAAVVFAFGWLRARRRSLQVSDFRRLERKVELLAAAVAKAAGGDIGMTREMSTAIGATFDMAQSPTRSDFGRAERKVDALVRALGMEDKIWPVVSPQVRELWLERRKIDAVRQYREEHPELGLKEAVEILEWVVER